MWTSLDLVDTRKLLLWVLCFYWHGLRSPASATRAPRDWRNMKYWTRPVLAVTYWEWASCLSMPEIDLMFRESEALRFSSITLSSPDVLCGSLCWVRRRMNYPASLSAARWALCVFRCGCVCLHSGYGRRSTNTSERRARSVLLSRVTLLRSHSSSAGLCLFCWLKGQRSQPASSWMSVCSLRHTEAERLLL